MTYVFFTLVNEQKCLDLLWNKSIFLLKERKLSPEILCIQRISLKQNVKHRGGFTTKMNLRRACRISVKTCFREKLEKLPKYINIPLKKSLVRFLGVMWLALLVFSVVMDFWFYLCVSFFFFPWARGKEGKFLN